MSVIINKSNDTTHNVTQARLKKQSVSVRVNGRGYVFKDVSLVDTSHGVLTVFVGTRIVTQFREWEHWNAS